MDILRIYLCCGLLLHKAVWEFMKPRDAKTKAAPPEPLRLRLVKAIKVTILGGIIVQTFLPEIFPISSAPDQLRIYGAIIYTAGLALALAGRIQLGNNWLDIESAAVKRTQSVVSEGVYQFVRHPIYGGDLLLLVGLELALNSWLVLLAFVLAAVVVRQAIREEQMLANSLPGYSEYCRRTKRFVPFVV